MIATGPQRETDGGFEDERLSELLGQLLRESDRAVSLQQIVDRTGGRSVYLLLIFLCLPFTTPIPLPGVSVVFGVVIGTLALVGSGRPGVRLPAWLGRWEVPASRQRLVLAASQRLVRWIERVVRPRNSVWLTGAPSRRAHGFLLAFLASLLLLPLPVPFTNSLPGYGIILTSACLMERDGRTIFLAYLVSLVATAYVAAVLFGGVEVLHLIRAWLGGQGGGAR